MVELIPVDPDKFDFSLPARRRPARSRRRPAHDNRRRPGRKQKRPVYCLDGEGLDLDDGRHVYTLLAASTSDGKSQRTITGTDLPTKECFDFLLSLPTKALLVGFSFDYDVNMMLRDVEWEHLERLWAKKHTWWKGYRISWTPHKTFSVKRGKKSVCVWDIFGYFQMAFSRALDLWEVGTEEERSAIREMKAKRSGFAHESQTEIATYCLNECRLGAQVFEKLYASTQRVGLDLRRYDGAGSIASAMMRKHDVANYLERGASTDLEAKYALLAYYGGRFDIAQYGPIGDCTEYDINSAYPYQCLSLPCLAHSAFEPSTSVATSPGTIQLFRVRWQIPPDARWGPFPYRVKKKILYPSNGEGWYWGKEVRAAQALYPGCIEILEGYSCTTFCDHQPFAYLREYFELRKQLKADKDLAQITIKLGMNSNYGKTAQNRGTYPPTYQSFLWAGLITSGTRAQLLAAVSHDPDATVLLATDALVTTRPIQGLSEGDGLGEWERLALDNLFVVQNGFYTSANNPPASRGYNPHDIDFDYIRALAHDGNVHEIAVRERQFQSLGAVLDRGDRENLWRRWTESESTIVYGSYPTKRVHGHILYPPQVTPDVLSSSFAPRVLRTV